jgi:hypothetical protein
MSKNLADALERMIDITASMMDSAAPSDEKVECPMCTLKASGAKEHEPECAYRIARTEVSPADLAVARRLVRALRYDGTP